LPPLGDVPSLNRNDISDARFPPLKQWTELGELRFYQPYSNIVRLE